MLRHKYLSHEYEKVKHTDFSNMLLKIWLWSISSLRKNLSVKGSYGMMKY